MDVLFLHWVDLGRIGTLTFGIGMFLNAFSYPHHIPIMLSMTCNHGLANPLLPIMQAAPEDGQLPEDAEVFGEDEEGEDQDGGNRPKDKIKARRPLTRRASRPHRYFPLHASYWFMPGSRYTKWHHMQHALRNF